MVWVRDHSALLLLNEQLELLVSKLMNHVRAKRFRIPVVLCGVSVLVNILYVVWERTAVPIKYRLTGERAKAISKTQRRPDFKVLMKLPW